jgi:phi13 family phage major tail protein
MATVGLEHLYYATITSDSQDIETYGLPQVLAKAISAELSIDIVEETLWADNGACYNIREFKSGKLTLNVADLTPQVVADLTGAILDDNGVMISSSDDAGKYVAVGFAANRPEGDRRFFWIYKCKFAAPSFSAQTKGDSISFATPKIEATIMRRNKPGPNGGHPWKCEVVESAPGVPASVISTWFSAVYEPVTTDE